MPEADRRLILTVATPLRPLNSLRHVLIDPSGFSGNYEPGKRQTLPENHDALKLRALQSDGISLRIAERP